MLYADVEMCAAARAWRAARHYRMTIAELRAECPNAKRPGGHNVRRAASLVSNRYRLTKRLVRSGRYWQVGAAVGFVSQYTRVPKLSGP